LRNRRISKGVSMIFIDPQQAVKQETPGWQRNLMLLSSESFDGTILLGFLLLLSKISVLNIKNTLLLKGIGSVWLLPE